MLDFFGILTLPVPFNKTFYNVKKLISNILINLLDPHY